MGQGRFVAKECIRILSLYHDGIITQAQMDRQLKTLNAVQSRLPFGAESSYTTESMGSSRPHNPGTQAGHP